MKSAPNRWAAPVIVDPQQQPLGVFTEHAVVGLLEKSVPLDSTAVVLARP
ncbi:MAG: hypothetical protein R3C28_10740 [Pirellulaceae bacterium]